MGTNTDPYQPIEGRYRITRAVLELCLETRHPVMITTKSDRVVADLDILTELARLNLVGVGISVTSLDPALSRLLEPRAASPAKRLDALARLASAGVATHVGIAPVIPAITDEYIEAILEAAASRGVQSASWIFVRLPHEVAPLFREWLEAHFPDRAAKVMSIVREVRGGRDNDPRFGARMKPQGVWAELYRRRFRLACQRHGIDRAREIPLDCTQFRKPDVSGQLRLL
jgi:DNA repair photolyase